jgi:hypothetical protein
LADAAHDFRLACPINQFARRHSHPPPPFRRRNHAARLIPSASQGFPRPGRPPLLFGFWLLFAGAPSSATALRAASARLTNSPKSGAGAGSTSRICRCSAVGPNATCRGSRWPCFSSCGPKPIASSSVSANLVSAGLVSFVNPALAYLTCNTPVSRETPRRVEMSVGPPAPAMVTPWIGGGVKSIPTRTIARLSHWECLGFYSTRKRRWPARSKRRRPPGTVSGAGLCSSSGAGLLTY